MLKHIAGLALAAGVAIACAPVKTVTGADLYDEFCVACHGTSGRGDGPAASSLPVRPADLTSLSSRNGGRFPMARVLSTIDGYTRVQTGTHVMPEFGSTLSKGPVLMVDTGDGIASPVPARLLALARHLENLQR
jgi:mono/diheme cytochrome c family protein